ncbi:FAD/NAD(P)-binding domain-containing protein [Dentipellis sp. KUC8613]|nr:FAD/NAD(P)-binding domain-containing protein [Dentipellis sp. KUC8613]
MSSPATTIYDCIVIGSGNAGSCAALSAIEHGCKRVLIVEKAPEEWVGGNGYFTAGAHRTVHGGLEDLLPIVTNVPPEMRSKIDVEPYTADQFLEDFQRLCGGRSDAALVKTVVDESRDAVEWLARYARIPFTLSFNRQAYEVDGRQKFWGGMALSTRDGGKGLIKAHMDALREAGVETWFSSPAVELVKEGDAVTGVIVERDGKRVSLAAKAVVLAAGGYEASLELRSKHIGPAWENARVRGTPYNTGDGISMAVAAGAKLAGDWRGCHATCWDANAPAHTGDRELSNQFTKSGYPLGIMVNAKGERFVDEGEDFRNYTYARFGKEILRQPGGYAFQIWDQKVISWLRVEEYGDGIVEKIWADSVEELAEKLLTYGLESKVTLGDTVAAYNDAVRLFQASHSDVRWDPAVKDGLSTEYLPLPKSNWALSLDKPPFLAVKVACGITFTFGGIAIDPETAAVLNEKTGRPIKGLFCTGEMVGGLWYDNYPGGSGLTAGAVFGRKAGRQAALIATSTVR